MAPSGEYHGFSYHGTSIEPPVVAATLGAKIIEAHFQLDEERSELENHVSLRASDFRAMVDRVRRVEEMLG
jgi:sialic acid synthase SpsE